ncbi:MAG: hypothetical protein U5L04_05765 [Trueperaceae bacterium]|nr:hypothetical protein [Trueperaceae bacterium]
MMIFLTPHVYYGDENAVTPDDYFGSEINKMLEEARVAVMFGNKTERRVMKKIEKKASEDSLVSTIVVEEKKKEKNGRRFRWPWQKKKRRKRLSRMNRARRSRRHKRLKGKDLEKDEGEAGELRVAATALHSRFNPTPSRPPP